MPKADIVTECFVTVENQAGELANIFQVLADAGINIVAYTAYVDGDYGFIKLIASDPEGAVKALDAKGYGCSRKQVLLVLTSDAVGTGAQVAKAIADAGLQIGHSHGSSAGGDQVALVFNTSDNARAAEAIGKTA